MSNLTTLEKCQAVIDENHTITLIENHSYKLSLDVGVKNYYSIYYKISESNYRHEESYNKLEDAVADWGNLE